MAAEEETLPVSAVLMSVAKHVAVRCRTENKAFMDCKNADRNPEACLEKGMEITRCVVDLMKELNDKCPKQLKAFHECMDYYSHDFQRCRKEQKLFEEGCPVNMPSSK